MRNCGTPSQPLRCSTAPQRCFRAERGERRSEGSLWQPESGEETTAPLRETVIENEYYRVTAAKGRLCEIYDKADSTFSPASLHFAAP